MLRIYTVHWLVDSVEYEGRAKSSVTNRLP